MYQQQYINIFILLATVILYLHAVAMKMNIRAMGYSRKKTKQEARSGLRISFCEAPTLELLDLLFHSQKFRRKQTFTPRSSAKLRDTPWKFQGQKPKSMEFPHDFFLNTPRNSTLIDFNVPPLWMFSGISQYDPADSFSVFNVLGYNKQLARYAGLL